MAKTVKFVPDKAGYRALMQSVGVAAISPHVGRIESSANAMCTVEGGVYGSKVEAVGPKTRMKVPYGIVHCENGAAMRDNADNNTLARALGGG